jgi:hypothetical protein
VRVITVVALGLLVATAAVLGSGVLQPAAVGERLAGVAVRVQDYRIEDIGGTRHRLHLRVVVTSATDIDECLGFALDEPFAQRRLDSEFATSCVKPHAKALTASLVYEHLTDDDLTFPSHSLVWGVPGGRCSLVFQATGICVVDVAGTADFELPQKNPLPSFGPLVSFGPIVPLYSFTP